MTLEPYMTSSHSQEIADSASIDAVPTFLVFKGDAQAAVLPCLGSQLCDKLCSIGGGRACRCR